jgi:hypothetical protein
VWRLREGAACATGQGAYGHKYCSSGLSTLGTSGLRTFESNTAWGGVPPALGGFCGVHFLDQQMDETVHVVPWTP